MTADTFAIGGDLPVRRIGLGTMQLTGPGHWYHPDDTEAAKQLLRRAVELGVNHLDTADAYGPETVEHLIRKALHPYPDDLVIATKGGLLRPGPNQWVPCGRPAYLRQCIEMSLRRLGIERIDLYYLHRIDPEVPLTDQLGVLIDAQRCGKIRHIGLSKIMIDQLAKAQQIATVAAVQNATLDACRAAGIAFVPYRPLGAGTLAGSRNPDDNTRGRDALRWLLQLGPHVLPIPGTSSIDHLTQNVAVTLPDKHASDTPLTADAAGVMS